MAGPNLPINVDATYADSPSDASRKIHQQHHDLIHQAVNLLDLTIPPVLQGTVSGNGFVALGDSISTAGVNGSSGGGYGGAWGHMVSVLSQQRLTYLSNAGVSGNNSTQVLARVPDVIALKPQVVTVLAGTNDLTQAVSFATWSANIIAIAAQLRAVGIRVVLCTIPPRGNTTYLATQQTWNAWLRAYAQQHSYDLLDFFALLVEPTTGMFKSGYDYGDALHPSQAAHLVMANYAIAQIVTPTYAPIQALTATDATNLVANPLLSAGSPTPTSWITAGVASADYTEALVTDSDFGGKAWEIAYTNAASSSNFRQFKSNTITGWSVGDVLLFTCRAKVTASSGVTPGTQAGLRLQALFTGGASVTPIAADAQVHGVGLFWFPITVPASTTAVQFSVIVGVLTVAGNFTARVGNFGIFNLTTANLLTV